MFAHVNTQIYSLIDRLREQHVRRLRRGNTSARWRGWGVPGRWPRWGGGARCEGESGTGPEAGRTGPDALGSGVRRAGPVCLWRGVWGRGFVENGLPRGRPARTGWWLFFSVGRGPSPQSEAEEPGARIPAAGRLEGPVGPGKPEGLGAWVRAGDGGGKERLGAAGGGRGCCLQALLCAHGVEPGTFRTPQRATCGTFVLLRQLRPRLGPRASVPQHGPGP